MKDPLAGYRDRINNREVSVVRWPNRSECPVVAGQEFSLRSCVIRMDQPTRKLVKGKWEWQCSFTRIEVDRPQLLRRVPSGMPDGPDKTVGLSDIERARVESAYTSSPHLALDGEPESVGPDWKDAGVAEREAKRQKAVRERMTEERVMREADNLAARVKQEVIRRGSKGHDLTHLLADVYERLAAEDKEAA